MCLFFLQLQQLPSYLQFCDFSLNKSCKIHLGSVLPPGSRNWQPFNITVYIMHRSLYYSQWNSMYQTPMQENSSLQVPQISNQLWCLKNEHNLNMDQNFNHQMSLSKSKCLYLNNCLHFFQACCSILRIYFNLEIW